MGKLTIQEISKILTEKNGLTPAEANTFATELFVIIQQQLQQGESVKVKGLGTFKIINVEARESVSVRTGERVMIESHSKVSFTPDVVMKELVNKPFSQFETVVLNDGVEFSDMKDEASSEENEPAEEESVAPVTIVMEQSTPSIESISSTEIPTVEPTATKESSGTKEATKAKESIGVEPTIEPEPVPEPEQSPVAEPAATPLVEIAEEEPEKTDADKEPQEEDFSLEKEKESQRLHWMLWSLCSLLLMALAAFGGYEFGYHQPRKSVVADTIFVRDTVYMPEEDTAIVEGIMEEASVVKEEPKPEIKEEPKPVVKEIVQPAPKQELLDKWSAKDERVRLGAYRIVGTKQEVTVLAGQTFYSICKAHLGPDMECYVEAYNNLPKNPTIKAGQVIKIPKLELKKKTKTR